MGVYDILFIINILMFIGVIIYHCFKNEKKAMLSDFIVLILFILIKVAQVYYANIRSFLYELLGPERFYELRDICSAVLSFGSSITVGLQLINELTNIFVLIFLASRVTAFFAKKCSKKIFSKRVASHNDKAESKVSDSNENNIYLVYGKLLN